MWVGHSNIAQERKEMQRSKDLQIMEAQRVLDKKEVQKQAMEVVKYENEVNKAIKREKKREQDEYEKKLNADYE